MPPDRGLSNKQHSGLKGKKTRLTYLLTTNANGTTKLPPLIIGKAHKPRCFQNKTGSKLGFNYRNNVKVWMTASLYQDWLEDWDHKLRQEQRNVFLLHDNFAGHIVPDTLTNICVEPFEPNLTSHVQPNDQGIIHSFKAHYRMESIEHAIECYEAGTTPSQIYDIDQLAAMCLADDAWNKVDATTIRNCWRKSSILPDFEADALPSQPSLPVSSLVHPSNTVPQVDPILQVEMLIKSILDKLESTGVLQCLNRMSITELLNPAVEAHNMLDTTDQDIFDVVVEVKRVKEGLAALGTGDVDDEPFEELPTRKEMLQAMLLVCRYTKVLNDPLACMVETTLGSFARRICTEEMQSKKDTKITSYFLCKE